jgi:hypothetical protein
MLPPIVYGNACDPNPGLTILSCSILTPENPVFYKINHLVLLNLGLIVLFPPFFPALHMAIVASLRARRPQNAFVLVRKMPAAKCKLLVVTFNPLIDACACQGGGWPDAQAARVDELEEVRRADYRSGGTGGGDGNEWATGEGQVPLSGILLLTL